MDRRKRRLPQAAISLQRVSCPAKAKRLLVTRGASDAIRSKKDGELHGDPPGVFASLAFFFVGSCERPNALSDPVVSLSQVSLPRLRRRRTPDLRLDTVRQVQIRTLPRRRSELRVDGHCAGISSPSVTRSVFWSLIFWQAPLLFLTLPLAIIAETSQPCKDRGSVFLIRLHPVHNADGVIRLQRRSGSSGNDLLLRTLSRARTA